MFIDFDLDAARKSFDEMDRGLEDEAKFDKLLSDLTPEEQERLFAYLQRRVIAADIRSYCRENNISLTDAGIKTAAGAYLKTYDKSSDRGYWQGIQRVVNSALNAIRIMGSMLEDVEELDDIEADEQ